MYRFRQGWVTDSGFVHLERVQMIMNELGRAEDQIFKKRQQDELHFRYIGIVPFSFREISIATSFKIGDAYLLLQETNEREK